MTGTFRPRPGWVWSRLVGARLLSKQQTPADKQTSRHQQTSRQAGKQASRLADKQTSRQADFFTEYTLAIRNVQSDG